MKLGLNKAILTPIVSVRFTLRLGIGSAITDIKMVWRFLIEVVMRGMLGILGSILDGDIYFLRRKQMTL